MPPRSAAAVPSLVRLRRTLHERPELSMVEHHTADVIDGWLTALGLRTKRIVKTGVVSTVGARRGGRTILARADIDALPVTEETGLSFASKNVGCMHACGHDFHAAGLVEVARRLAADPPRKGRAKLLFQPGEEGANGMGQCIDAGLLQRPRVDAAVGVHVWSPMRLGTIGLVRGPAMAAIDTFEITVHGNGGHAAYPHTAVDPVVIAAHVVTALQTLASRTVDPRDSVVVTVGALNAGTAFNVIPPCAVLKGTVRTFDPKVRRLVERRLKKLVRNVASGLGGRADIDWIRLLPPVVNDGDMVDLAWSVAEEVVGKRNVKAPRPTMGSEDMGIALQHVPGVFAFVGGCDGTPRTSFPHHHPRFDLSEDVLPIQAAFIEGVVRRYLAA